VPLAKLMIANRTC